MRHSGGGSLKDRKQQSCQENCWETWYIIVGVIYCLTVTTSVTQSGFITYHCEIFITLGLSVYLAASLKVH